ncbi:MAG TPA: hypothetical protein PK455_05305 [Caldisericia bacterium]|nr:hypothetical protein [Caldisericia bacterium]
MKSIFNKLIIFYCNISKFIILKYLTVKKLFNKKVIYFKNKDLREEILLDENYTPHYTTTYSKAIDIDANAFNILRAFDSEKCEKPLDFSINIKKVKK